jgi:ABC-type Fe3+-citrate transport system substrate-binding protein
MRQLKLVSLLLVCCVIFSGCGKMSGSQVIENESPELKMSSAEAEEAQTEISFQPNTTFAGLLSSIENEEKLDCKYLVKDEETFNEIEAHIYIEGEKYKSITYTTSGDTLYSIFDGDVFYSWSKLQGQGFRMSKSCAERFADAQSEQEEGEDFELDSYKTSSELFDENVVIGCDKTSYVDISIPAEITFVDQCEMLEKQIEQIRQIQR